MRTGLRPRLTDMMDSPDEIARAHEALSAPAAVPDRRILGAVHTGLLLVPSEPPTARVPGARPAQDDLPKLTRRRAV